MDVVPQSKLMKHREYEGTYMALLWPLDWIENRFIGLAILMNHVRLLSQVLESKFGFEHNIQNLGLVHDTYRAGKGIKKIKRKENQTCLI